MTEMLVRAPSFEFPAPTKPIGTLLDVATVLDDIGWLEPSGLAESYNCLRMDSRAVWPCPPGQPATKNFGSSGWQSGIRFAAYGGNKCKGPGFDMATATSKTRAAFDAMESFAVEKALMNLRFSTTGPGWSPATDITPAGGAVSPIGGLSMLEGDVACNYAGVPTIHVPRSVASMLTNQGAVEAQGSKLVTKIGSKVAAGGGYGCPSVGPGGLPAAAGEAWMYGSGEVVVSRGDVIEVAELDRTTNDVYILIERPYVVAVDCYVSAVRVKVG